MSFYGVVASGFAVLFTNLKYDFLGKYKFLAPSVGVGALITQAVYHGKALYDKYQYDQSLEHKVEVEINGVKETVNASPKYFDWYTAYHAFGVATGVATVVLCSLEVSDTWLTEGVMLAALPLGAFLSKLISLKDKYQDFQYTDSKGNEISPEIVESNFIGYIGGDATDNVSQILQNSVIDCNSSFTIA